MIFNRGSFGVIGFVQYLLEKKLLLCKVVDSSEILSVFTRPKGRVQFLPRLGTRGLSKQCI